jgi:formate-nitrite transporter family protein
VPADLKEQEHQQAEERSAVRAHVVHEAIVRQGEDELERSSSSLAWSGLAAGLSMSLSFLAESALRAHMPDAVWRPLIAKLGYTVGFLVVILGRQQLFTENTLTPILPLLRKKERASVSNVLRLWAVVLMANLIGAHIAAWFFGNTPAVSVKIQTAMHDIASEAMQVDFTAALVRGIVAGWLIALVVWLSAAVEHAEFVAIFVPTYLIAIGGFTHVVAGATEVLFLVFTGQLAWITAALTYIVPALIGNIIGGMALVTALNHAQVASDQ